MADNRLSIMGTRHVVSAGHYLAAHAGFEVLEAGGNAIDAGVAAGIAIGVLQTDKVNFAGVAPQIIYTAAVIAGARSKIAYVYLRYLRSINASAVWQRHGFEPGG